LADTISTAASVTWIIYANRKIEENEPKAEAYTNNQFGGVDYSPASDGSPSDVTSFKWLRAGGYVSLGLFAASAIYGWVVEGQCHALRQELAANKAPKEQDVSPTRQPFPASVLDYSFEFRPDQAQQHCFAQGRHWSLQGSVGVCKSERPSTERPTVQLDFELGTPSRITVSYPTPAEQLIRSSRVLEASVTKIYGPPQAQAAPLSASCTASLAGCLQDGERPAGPTWRWARGSIAISSSWKDDGAWLELHYQRAEANAP